MLDLLLTVCLAADTSTCTERRVVIEQCESRGAARAKAWDEAHPMLTVAQWTCAPELSAPALDVAEVAPGVLVHAGAVAEPDEANQGDVANMGAVIGETSVAVIDAGGSRAVGEAWLATIRQHTSLPLRWLILTHMHPDHVLGAAPFVEAGATVVGHHHLPDALARREETYLRNFGRLAGEEPMMGAVVVQPDRTVADTMEIDLGERPLLLTAEPTAHTDNDLTVLDRKTGTLFAGDLVFLEHTPALDGSAKGWLDVLQRIGNSDSRLIVPGHGPASAGPPADAVAPTTGYLKELVGEIRSAIAEGAPMSAVVESAASERSDDWALYQTFHARNATAAYSELEWE